MKKTQLLVLTIVSIATLVLSGCTQSTQTPPEIQTSEKTTVPSTELVLSPSTQNIVNSIENSSKYQVFSPETLDALPDQRRVLFFFANWCPTCIPADKEFQNRQAELPNDVVIIRVNYNDTETDDQEKELAKKYGVTYQHSFVQIDQNGNAVSKWNGGKFDELLKNLK